MFSRIFILSCLAVAPALTLAQTDAEVPAAPVPAAAPIVAEPTATAPAVRPEDAPAMPRNKEERDQMEARAQQLNSEAISIKQAATERQAAAKKECWQRFLVSSCLDDERVLFRKEESRAKQMERDAKLLERNVRRYDAAENTARRDAENARKDIENEARAAKFRAEQEARQKK